ncbi:MAG: exodeoxyribonuclease VII large subunit [Bacilli bacterium]
MNNERTIYTVNDVNQHIKSLISQDTSLKYILVKGEISNFKNGAAGHLYFSLKDKDSLINVVMFSAYAQKIVFVPKNGDEVIVLASVDVYAPRGSYQLFCYEMQQVGQGTLLVELEKLKKKLQLEGLFDVSRKRSINLYPHAIGVITAKNSAAIKDIVTNIKRRYPIADIYVFYSAVQGESAPKEILKAFNEAQKYDLDTLIIGRGGGSSEDLSAFNDETLVRAIANSKMPIIAAVGHEIDTTLVDYVADKRASTPTGAAELATVDRREIEQHFQYCLDDMKEAIIEKLNDMRENVSERDKELQEIFTDKISGLKDNIDDIGLELKEALANKLEYLHQTLVLRQEQLKALNPRQILERGYSITADENGKVVTNIKEIKKASKIITYISGGKIKSTVDEIEERKL